MRFKTAHARRLRQVFPRGCPGLPVLMGDQFFYSLLEGHVAAVGPISPRSAQVVMPRRRAIGGPSK
jgi:hypothetical protein